VRAIGESQDLSRRLNFVGPEDEVGRLAATFDGMMERLERVFETQKRFIADASHELRTPLTAIRGNADLLRIAPPEDREACLSAIRREAERMTRLVSDLLLLAEADVAQQQIQIGRVDLDEVVTDVFQAARIISGGRVDVVLENADPVCVQGDGDRIKQLLLNLMDNAVKFTPEGGTVSIGLWRDGDTARIDVADSGVGNLRAVLPCGGIPLEARQRAWPRHQHLDRARPWRLALRE
jgi:signal transduction histidine kinase